MAQGHRIIIISGSLDIYLRPWAEQLAVDHLIATELESTPDGSFTGRIRHYHVGKKKLVALYELLGQYDHPIDYAYGDSIGDRYLLAAADNAYWIRNPNEDIEKARVDPETHKKWKRSYL